MKWVSSEALTDSGGVTGTPIWDRIIHDLRDAINAIRWPPGAPSFNIYPERHANGVVPIKLAFIARLLELGWHKEGKYADEQIELTGEVKPGAFDARLNLSSEGLPPFVVEWETGNISSSHRAMNKMALGLIEGVILGGILVLPTRVLGRWVTDRIGNYPELQPYFPLWTNLPVRRGYLGVITVEHDATSTEVPQIPKGKDGRARG
jgi:hypothetical protein